MGFNAPSVTGETDVTRFPYNPHTCARVCKASYGKIVTLVTSVSAFLVDGPRSPAAGGGQ